MAALLAVAALLGAAALAIPAEAVVVTWNTCNGNANGGTICIQSPAPQLPASPRSSSGSGENRTFSFEAIGDSSRLLTARAFKTQNNYDPFGVIQKTTITIWAGGLGAGPGRSPLHAVGNNGPDEMIVFQFGNDDYIPLSFRIGWKHTDADIVTYIGGSLGGPDDALDLFLSGSFGWDELGGALTTEHGYVRQEFLDVTVGVDQLFTSAASGRFLIIAARNETDGCPSRCKDGGEDAFKIQQIVGVLPDRVAEPGTLLLLGLGLTSLGLLNRRRSAA